MRRRRPHVRFALAAAAGMTFSCSLFVPFSDYDSEPRTGASIDGSRGDRLADPEGSAPTTGDAAADAVTADRALRGPEMIQTGAMAIDVTEVTQAQYEEFLNANVPIESQDQTTCFWNDSFAPARGCGTFDPVVRPNHPVLCIDWCDAVAFCKWAGKRLCGKIGGGEGPRAEMFDPAKNEWYAACTDNGRFAFPYGNAYQAGRCVDSDGSAPVTSRSSCTGGYAGLFDVSGNAAEWADTCTHTGDAARNESCLARGGSWKGGINNLRCDSSDAYTRDTRGTAIGFRCCGLR
jgi:formylglycine-generating enzyme